MHHHELPPAAVLVIMMAWQPVAWKRDREQVRVLDLHRVGREARP